jgi:hypothetical protein
MNRLVRKLLKARVISGETVAMDATFIKAYSKRDQHQNSRGSSDPEARVGRNGKTYDLGYKLHVAADARALKLLTNHKKRIRTIFNQFRNRHARFPWQPKWKLRQKAVSAKK